MAQDKTREFYADLVESCVENKINLKLIHRHSVDRSGGFFDGSTLASCFKRPYWLRILVHESCHLDQMVEKSPLWLAINDEDDLWSAEWVDANKRNGKALKVFKQYCELEIDCDIRTANKIHKYNLPIPLIDHIREANCYHASYYYFYKRKIFYSPKCPPYLNQDLCSHFPKDYMMTLEECWKPNKVLDKFFKEHSIPLK